MKIKSIKLTNVRNWSEKNFDFSDRVLIYGPNAQGKTNILESLYMLATTRSFKGKDAEIIKKEADFMKVYGVIESDKDREVEILVKRSPLKLEKEFRIEGRKRPSIDFVGEFSAIIFSPEEINVLTGPPEGKRRYLSFTLGQKDREYLFDLLNYKKILRHRNELLKRADLGTIKDEIDIWDQSLSEYGQKIIEKRKKLTHFINERFSEYYDNLTGQQVVMEFRYLPAMWGEDLKESLFNSREKDINERTTTVGPHRDTWEVFLNDMDVAKYCSRGELRTVLLALKLCERDHFLSKDENPPVVLLDDVFSELDDQRRKYLLEAFKGSQLIMTTTDLDHLDKEFKESTQLLEIADNYKF